MRRIDSSVGAEARAEDSGNVAAEAAATGGEAEGVEGAEGGVNPTEAEDAQLAKEFGLEANKVREFREVFQIVDQDGSGQIGKEEVATLLKMLGAPKSDEEVAHMVKEVDADESGEIDFGEFLAVMTARPSVPFNERQLMEAFNLYASTADFKHRKDPGFVPTPRGYIRPKDLQLMLMDYLGKLGLTDEDEVEELITSIPINKEGNIHYSDFVQTFFSID